MTIFLKTGNANPCYRHGARIDTTMNNNTCIVMRRASLAMLAALWLGIAVPTSLAAESYQLAFATYFGGNNADTFRDVCVDSQGNIIAVGGTSSADFPTTAGAYCRNYNAGRARGMPGAIGSGGTCDAVVAEFDSSGQLIWSTMLGGPNYDRAYGVKVDRRGAIYVAGRAGEGFPVTQGAFQTEFADTNGSNLGLYGKQNGFVAKLTPDGQLIWASYVGVGQLCRDIAIDDQGDIYLPSGWNGVGRPPPAAWFANAYQKAPQGGGSPKIAGGDTCVLKVKGDGSRVVWATWLCGSGTEALEATIGLDRNSNVYYLMTTESKDMPTPGNGRHIFGGGRTDCYLGKLTPDGSRLIYGTYLGGAGDDVVDTHELAVDAQWNAYVGIRTTSRDWPVTPGVFQPRPGGGKGDLVIGKVGLDGALAACSYLGADAGKDIEGISVDRAGNVYVTGATRDVNFPMAGAPLQSAYGPDNSTSDGVYQGNGFLTVIAADFKSLRYSSFLGKQCSIAGKNAFGGLRCNALAADGSVIVAGSWHSAGFPTKNAYQASHRGGPLEPPYAAADAVLAKFVPIHGKGSP
jgi:hypothetical protein